MAPQITLTIGYDGKRAACNSVGLGNYSRYVVEAMACAYPSNRYLLYTPKVRCPQRLEPLLAMGNVELCTPGTALGRVMAPVWRSLELTRRMLTDGIDLYHGLSNELPLNIYRSDIPSVVTIHDLIYRRVPADYAAIDRRLYDLKYRHSARVATRVICISECTKRDLINDYGISPDKIDVIYQGCDAAFHRPVDKQRRLQVRERYGLPERYIISVGTVQSRKNQLLAVKALRGLPTDVVLAIAGRRDKHYGAEIDRYIASHHLGERVKWLGSVEWADLPALYAGSAMSSYTSRYEGFGIPVIEAIAAGAPVIASTGSCLEEAGGPGAVYVAPDDVDAYIDQANRLLDQRWTVERMIADGRRYIRRFNTADFARATMACYTKAIAEKYL